MKRDMDLVREILLTIEKDEGSGHIRPRTPGYSAQEITYHIEIMKEAGLVEAEIIRSSKQSSYILKRLTWQGHEFLDAARDETLWKKAKEKVLEKTSGLSIDLLKAVLLNLGKQALE